MRFAQAADHVQVAERAHSVRALAVADADGRRRRRESPMRANANVRSSCTPSASATATLLGVERPAIIAAQHRPGRLALYPALAARVSRQLCALHAHPAVLRVAHRRTPLGQHPSVHVPQRYAHQLSGTHRLQVQREDDQRRAHVSRRVVPRAVVELLQVLGVERTAAATGDNSDTQTTIVFTDNADAATTTTTTTTKTKSTEDYWARVERRQKLCGANHVVVVRRRGPSEPIYVLTRGQKLQRIPHALQWQAQTRRAPSERRQRADAHAAAQQAQILRVHKRRLPAQELLLLVLAD